MKKGRYDREAFRMEYVTAGDDMTLELLSSMSGISLVQVSRRAGVGNWERVQSRDRQRMGCVRATDILDRRRSPAILTAGARRAFQLNSRSDSTSGPLPPR